MPIHATFSRLSPAAFAEKIGVPQGWFVISHRYVQHKKDRRQQHGRWFKLTTSEGVVFRVLRFSPNLAGAPGKPGEIVIDYPAWLDLYGRAENVDEPLAITIEQASWWEWPKLAVSHPDPSVRLAGWLAVLSFALGVISLLLGIWSLWKTYNP